MKVADLMQTDVHTVTADMPVSEAIVALEDGRISGLPVVDARNRVVGVVSSTDIIGAQAETHSPEEQRILLEDTRVQDIMTPRPLLIEPDADVDDAAGHVAPQGFQQPGQQRGGHRRAVGLQRIEHLSRRAARVVRR